MQNLYGLSIIISFLYEIYPDKGRSGYAAFGFYMPPDWGIIEVKNISLNKGENTLKLVVEQGENRVPG